MTFAITLLLSVVLLLAPQFAATPEDPQHLAPIAWSSCLCAGTMLAVLLGVIAACRGEASLRVPLNQAEKAFLVLLGLALLSLPARLVVQHGAAYLGPMLRGWAILATYAALFGLARRIAAQAVCLYGLTLAGGVSAAIIGDRAVQEYIPYLRAGHPEARIFATSTPDFLAGYLVMALPLTLALVLQIVLLPRLTPLLRALATLVGGIVLLFLVIALLATSSRFALVSLAAGLLTFGLSLAWASRHGLFLPRGIRAFALTATVLVIMAGAAFAKPVIARLHNFHDNSTAFRVWTWKGAVRMAAANPLLGTGIGTWADLYPRYALTGFTRAAHNSYLQMADECGIPALLVLLATLGLLGASLTRGLAGSPSLTAPVTPRPRPQAGTPSRKPKRTPAPLAAPETSLLPTDHRLLLSGLLAALGGGVIQNLVDSDWYVFFLGATLWTLAGLAAGISSDFKDAASRQASPAFLFTIGGIAAALGTLTAMEGIAAFQANQAQTLTANDPDGAAQRYAEARAWDPWNGHYPSDQGYKVYFARLGSLPQAETALRGAVAREPNSVNYRRLGMILQQEGRQPEAMEAYEAGLQAEPNSLDLLLNLAQVCSGSRSRDYYRRLSDLELTPVGTVRALGESTETKFAVADAAMGDAAAKMDPTQAIGYYARAATLLQKYAEEGGSLNGQRQILSGGHSDPGLDADRRRLYRHVMTAWIALAPAEAQAGLRQRAQKYGAIFDKVLAGSSIPGTL